MMPPLEAVDAKIARARSELRLLRAEIAAFCQDRARLIVRELVGHGEERWVYRGDVSKAPIEWSIRAGEVAYNLRSALDHLVWQLVKANDKNPCSRNAFPIQGTRNKKIFAKRLLGVSPDVKDYIASVQPYHLEATTSGDPVGTSCRGSFIAQRDLQRRQASAPRGRQRSLDRNPASKQAPFCRGRRAER